jgi:Ca2+-binding EF-hand superfamily protein
VVLEAQDKRAKCSVVPRKLPDAYEHKVRAVWQFDQSVWANYKFDTDETFEQCFDVDWNCGKLEKFIKGSKSAIASKNLQEMFKSVARQAYSKVVFGYRIILAGSEQSGLFPFGANMLDYTHFLHSLAPDFFDSNFSVVRDSDSIFIAANLVIDKEKKAELFLVAPEKGLARCQFLEAIVRVAHKKYFTTQKCHTIAAAFKEIVGVMEPVVKKWSDLQKELHAQLFNEENDMIFKDHKERTRMIFDHYQTKHPNGGRPNGNLSFRSWFQFCDSCGIDEHLCKREYTQAWFIAKQTSVDELKNWRYMEMNYVEFLVGLGALMKLRPDFEPDFFADLLDEFFEENLFQVLDQIRQEEASARGCNPRDSQVADPALIPVLAFLRRIFEEADDDHSGSIDMREFRVALSSPEIQEEMKNLGLNISDVGLLFRQMDADGSGSATLDEMCAGFVKMKLAMSGMERALAYIERTFEQADADGSGFLSQEEFLNFFTKESVKKKLTSLGIDAEDHEDILGFIDGDGDGNVSLEELMHGFLSVRDANKSGNKAMNFMSSLFREADKNGNGMLDRTEFKSAFTDPRTITKLQRLNLRFPEWDALFVQLDEDQTGEVSWEEVSQGIQLIWQQAQVAGADALAGKKAKKERSSIVEESPTDESQKMLQANVAMQRASIQLEETVDIPSATDATATAQETVEAPAKKLARSKTKSQLAKAM